MKWLTLILTFSRVVQVWTEPIKSIAYCFCKFDLMTVSAMSNLRQWIGHTEATNSHILSRGPPTVCHHCGQTMTIDHMLLEFAVLQGCRDEYYKVDSLNTLFQTIPEAFIVKFLREAGFFYLIRCNLLTSTSPQTSTIWSDLREWKQLWVTFTWVWRLICPKECVVQIQSNQSDEFVV